MMKIKNSYGLTLIELLVTVTIAFTVMGLISSVLIQSFRNMEIADTHINLRQEANILLAMINSSHLSPININDSSSNKYTISYNRINTAEWELTIGNQVVSNQDYEISLELEQKVPGELLKTFSIDPTTTGSNSFNIVKRQPLTVKKIKLINKKNSANTFELSTIISRL